MYDELKGTKDELFIIKGNSFLLDDIEVGYSSVESRTIKMYYGNYKLEVKTKTRTYIFVFTEEEAKEHKESLDYFLKQTEKVKNNSDAAAILWLILFVIMVIVLPILICIKNFFFNKPRVSKKKSKLPKYASNYLHEYGSGKSFNIFRISYLIAAIVLYAVTIILLVVGKKNISMSSAWATVLIFGGIAYIVSYFIIYNKMHDKFIVHNEDSNDNNDDSNDSSSSDKNENSKVNNDDNAFSSKKVNEENTKKESNLNKENQDYSSIKIEKQTKKLEINKMSIVTLIVTIISIACGLISFFMMFMPALRSEHNYRFTGCNLVFGIYLDEHSCLSFSFIALLAYFLPLVCSIILFTSIFIKNNKLRLILFFLAFVCFVVSSILLPTMKDFIYAKAFYDDEVYLSSLEKYFMCGGLIASTLFAVYGAVISLINGILNVLNYNSNK